MEIENFIQAFADMASMSKNVDDLHQLALAKRRLEIWTEVQRQTPDNPALAGWSAFSQSDEDGIIREILRRLGMKPFDATFIEIGVGTGQQCNTHLLAIEGARGVWIEAKSSAVRKIPDTVRGDVLKVVRQRIDPSNVAKIINSCRRHLMRHVDDVNAQPTILSIDIDGGDLALAIEVLRYCEPSILIVEYNAKFPPPIKLESAAGNWDHDDYFGASLQSYCDALSGYRLVACNLAGVNGFFILDSHLVVETFEPYSVDQLYRPPAYELTRLRTGHRPSMKWLVDAVRPDREVEAPAPDSYLVDPNDPRE